MTQSALQLQRQHSATTSICSSAGKLDGSYVACGASEVSCDHYCRMQDCFDSLDSGRVYCPEDTRIDVFQNVPVWGSLALLSCFPS